MSIKYKIDDAKKNKNLINDEIKLSRIKSKGGPGDSGRKSPKPRKAPTWFIEFRDEQREFNTRMEKEVLNLRNDISNLDKRFDNLVRVNNLKE